MKFPIELCMAILASTGSCPPNSCSTCTMDSTGTSTGESSSGGGDTSSNIQEPTCSDSESYTFTTLMNGTPLERHCSFLTSNPSRTAIRLSKFCDKISNGSVVKDECPDSCGICGNEQTTPEPTSEPTTTQQTCQDSDSYTFTTLRNGQVTERKCQFLTANPSSASFRKGKFCSQSFHGYVVKDMCPESCDNCGTELPTSEPTTTVTTSQQTCQDSDSYTFTTLKNGQVTERKCQFLTANPSFATFRKTKFCSQSFHGYVVKDMCPESCDNCGTELPTSAPTTLGTPLATGTGIACTDSETFTFFSRRNGQLVERGCTFLSNEVRKLKFCDATQNGSVIGDECQLSCSRCPTSTVAGPVCKDSTSYEFDTIQFGKVVKRGCDWLTKNQENFRKAKFCGQTSYGKMVQDECLLSCDNCPTNQPSTEASAEPTMSPSVAISSSPSVEESASPSVVPTGIPTTEPYVCEDSEDFRIETFSNNKLVKRRCDWLTAKPSDADYRVWKFCEKIVDGTVVKDACLLSCGNCPTMSPSTSGLSTVTNAPVASPSVVASLSCEDSTTFEFYTKINGVQIPRTCDWLTKKASESIFRIAKFCPNIGAYNTTVQDACPLSCDNCPTHEPSDSPSVHFSPTPSFEPTVFSSPVPSASPTLVPLPTSSPSRPPSPFPSPFPSARPSPGPVIAPSMLPSAEPTGSPSVSIVPSAEPTTSHVPTVSIVPSAGPTTSPSTEPSVSISPSTEPTTSPSAPPSALPSAWPSASPSTSPSTEPSVSASPSSAPSKTISPSAAPSDSPSDSPSTSPSTKPSVSASPSTAPSKTVSPSAAPSDSPSDSPSAGPSASP